RLFFLLSFFVTIRGPPSSPLFPYTTLFRSGHAVGQERRRFASGEPYRSERRGQREGCVQSRIGQAPGAGEAKRDRQPPVARVLRSEEHTSELQSRFDLVCRLLLEKKKKKKE